MQVGQLSGRVLCCCYDSHSLAKSLGFSTILALANIPILCSTTLITIVVSPAILTSDLWSYSISVVFNTAPGPWQLLKNEQSGYHVSAHTELLIGYRQPWSAIFAKPCHISQQESILLTSSRVRVYLRALIFSRRTTRSVACFLRRFTFRTLIVSDVHKAFPYITFPGSSFSFSSQ